MKHGLGAAFSCAEIKQATGNKHVDLLVADLRLLQEVRRLAEAFQQKYGHLHILVNNAGGTYRSRTVTAEGLEATLAFNHLTPFLLTELLLGVLKASADELSLIIWRGIGTPGILR